MGVCVVHVCVWVCVCVGRCIGMGGCVLDEGGGGEKKGQTNILLTLCGSSLHAGTWMMSSLWR